MLDRLSVILPRLARAQRRRHRHHTGRMLAYVGDYLSYQQDATATESYLGTARRRVSVAGMRGCSTTSCTTAAMPACGCRCRSSADEVKLSKKTRLLTTVAGQPHAFRLAPDSLPLTLRALSHRPEAFETMHAATLF